MVIRGPDTSLHVRQVADPASTGGVSEIIHVTPHRLSPPSTAMEDEQTQELKTDGDEILEKLNGKPILTIEIPITPELTREDETDIPHQVIVRSPCTPTCENRTTDTPPNEEEVNQENPTTLGPKPRGEALRSIERRQRTWPSSAAR